jgi:methylated-DNA-[protein]-cysteine S-methyltransferase
VAESVLLAVLDSSHGPIHAAATEAGVCALAFRTTTVAFTAGLTRMGLGPVDPVASAPATDARRRHLDRLAPELAEYWTGDRRRIEVPLDLRVASAWDRRILEAVGTIGYGETLSYGSVAARAGAPRAARAAGGAVGRNPIGLLIPCHRVIAGDGSLGGYGGSWFGEREELLALKRALLAAEGVTLRG